MKKLYRASLCLASVLLVSSCVDSNYDLSDIDTTTAIKVDGLVVPVRLNDITLDNVLEIDKEDGLIGIYTDRNNKSYYAIKQDGSFSAEPVKIEDLKFKSSAAIPPITIAQSGKIENLIVDFSYIVNDVDDALLNLTDFVLKEGEYLQLDIEVQPSTVSVTDMKIQIPSSYVAVSNGQTYTDGLIPVNIVNGKLQSPVYITEMRFDPYVENINNTLDFTGKVGIASATIDTKGQNATIQFDMSPFTANVVSGTIDYSVDAPYINPVELTNLPGFLTDGETNLILQNPQIYLDFSPLYGAEYSTSITIKPEGKGVIDTHIDVSPFQTSIVMAVDPTDLGLPNLYTSPVLQPVPQLKDVLSGEGLPQRLNIDLGAMRMKGHIEGLVLDGETGIDLEGSYTFFTPLAFGAGSHIIYSTTEQDFFGDDVEDVKVKELQLSAKVTTNLPFSVELTVYPLDKEGNKLDKASTKVPANAQGTAFDVHFTNPFSGLDGVCIEVTAEAIGNNSLTPDQVISLSNIQAKISGEYVTDF